MLIFSFLIILSTDVSAKKCDPRLAFLAANIGVGGQLVGTERAPDLILTPKFKSHVELIGFQRNRTAVLREVRRKFSGFPPLYASAQIVPPLVAAHRWVRQMLEIGVMPISIGGDHSIAIATASAALQFSESRKKKIALVWVDAHTDYYYVPNSRQFAHGIAVNQLVGNGSTRFYPVTGRDIFFKPKDILFIGARDKFTKREPDRREFEAKGFSVMTSEEAQSLDETALQKFLNEHFKDYDAIHLSFDIDVVTEEGIRGFGHPLKNGIGLSQTTRLMKALGKTGKITSLDFVEFNPLYDSGGRTARAVQDIILVTLRSIVSGPSILPTE